MKLGDIPVRTEAAADPLDGFRWPNADYTRTPYRVFTDAQIYEREMARIFRGATWNYLALEAEVPEPGSFKMVQVGNVPVVVSRNMQGVVTAFVNRCAHRGVRFCQQPHGNARSFVCPYHQWTYKLNGELAGLPFKDGVAAVDEEGAACVNGGMPADFDVAQHGLTRLRVAVLHGLVFALSQAVPALAVDPVAGGGKVAAQAAAWEWPAVVPAEELTEARLDHWWEWCNSREGARRAASCATSGDEPMLVGLVQRLLGESAWESA